VVCQSTSVANWSFTNLAKELQIIFLVMFLLAKCWTLQNILKVLVLKVFEGQHSVFFIGFDAIMKDYAVGLTPECATLEAVETLGALLVAIST